jgi:hypothetical protein
MPTSSTVVSLNQMFREVYGDTLRDMLDYINTAPRIMRIPIDNEMNGIQVTYGIIDELQIIKLKRKSNLPEWF